MTTDAVCAVCGKTYATNASANRPICSQCQEAAISVQPTQPAESTLTAIQDERLRAIYPPEFDGERLASHENDRNATGNPGLVNAALFVALAFFALAIFLGFVCVATK